MTSTTGCQGRPLSNCLAGLQCCCISVGKQLLPGNILLPAEEREVVWVLLLSAACSSGCPAFLLRRLMFDMIGSAAFATRFNALQDPDHPFIKVMQGTAASGGPLGSAKSQCKSLTMMRGYLQRDIPPLSLVVLACYSGICHPFSISQSRMVWHVMADREWSPSSPAVVGCC
jgi:hypothetical protein